MRPQESEGLQGPPEEMAQTELNMLNDSIATSNGVVTLTMNVDPNYRADQAQLTADRLDELNQ